MSGRIEFESATGRPTPAAAQIQQRDVHLMPVDGRLPNIMVMAVPDRANAQGEFQTKGYEAGKYFLNVTGSGPWQLKAATIGGRDVLDAPIELRDTDITGVVVTFVGQDRPDHGFRADAGRDGPFGDVGRAVSGRLSNVDRQRHECLAARAP